MSGRTCGMLGLAQVILTGCQGIPKSLPDDVLKVRVHGGMRAQFGPKGKPCQSRVPLSFPAVGRACRYP